MTILQANIEAHNHCNLNLKKCQFIPIIFHNLSGYGCHLFIKELSGIFGRINLILKSKENYISFTRFIPIDKTNTAQLKFIDSFNFLCTSLDKLTKTLHTNNFHHMRLYFPDKDLFKLVCRKGVYCYDYMDGWEKYNETKLHDKSHFFNKLIEDDYQHAITVWKTFKITSLGEYTDIYLKCNVLLLCDIYEKFRDMSLDHYSSSMLLCVISIIKLGCYAFIH